MFAARKPTDLAAVTAWSSMPPTVRWRVKAGVWDLWRREGEIVVTGRQLWRQYQQYSGQTGYADERPTSVADIISRSAIPWPGLARQNDGAAAGRNDASQSMLRIPTAATTSPRRPIEKAAAMEVGRRWHRARKASHPVHYRRLPSVLTSIMLGKTRRNNVRTRKTAIGVAIRAAGAICRSR